MRFLPGSHPAVILKPTRLSRAGFAALLLKSLPAATLDPEQPTSSHLEDFLFAA